MKLSKIVDAVNAKSFGETDWTYDDIYQYFQEAIAAINGEVEEIRRLPSAPNVSEDDPYYSIAAYNTLSDTHILNYIVTYIVVAMDNAQLAVTSRTQTYATQLAKYKQQLIADLYKWMPLRGDSNVYFDLEYKGVETKRIPNVGNVWYDEDEGGILSCNASNDNPPKYNTNPSIGVHCENPYGYLVPRDPNQRILEGKYYYNYVFVPYDSFRKFYDPVGVRVLIEGHNIEYSAVPYTTIEILDVKSITNSKGSNIDFNGKTIINVSVATPTSDSQPVPKAYVDNLVGALQTAVDSLVGTDVASFATQLNQLSTTFNNFISGTSADDVINTLSEIQASITNLQSAVNNRTTDAQVRAIIDDMFADISEEEF